MIQKIHGYFHLSCDVCGEEVSSEDWGARFFDFDDALAYAKSNDWTFQRGQNGWENICPVCSSVGIGATTWI